MSIAMAITEALIADALHELSNRDEDIARAVQEVGHPPTRNHEPGFATLIGIITAQQISAAAASAIRARLETAADPLTPENFLALDDAALAAVGLSGRKIEYGRALATTIVSGEFGLANLSTLPEEEARASLISHKGIGRWSAEIYLLFALGRTDVWPADDLAVAVAVQKLKSLNERPNRERMEAIAEPWRPWRGIVALLMWQYYRGAPFGADGQTAKKKGVRK
jgi:DNA-3-methyladenine glycosylase II